MKRYRYFQPTIDGKKRHAYYVLEHGKKHAVRVHPETGDPFRSKAEVERWIDRLRGREVRGSSISVEELARYLFDARGPWAERQARKRGGRPLAPHTLQEHELNVRLHIIPALGDADLADVDTQAIDHMLYKADLSNRARRNVAWTLRLILKEAVYRRIIPAVPSIEMPSKTSRKPYVPTAEEVAALFPADRGSLRQLWQHEIPKREDPRDALALAGCAAVMFLGGLRPQEARAAWMEQLLRDIAVLLVTRSMDSHDKALPYLKMADVRDPRYRGTLLTNRATTVLDHWLSERPGGDWLFSYRGAPITSSLLHDRLRLAAGRAKISLDGRRLIPYSGRYHYDTVIRPLLPLEVLMLLMGHLDRAMPERYDVPTLTDRMRQLSRIYGPQLRAIG